jgi:hypothetical protein
MLLLAAGVALTIRPPKAEAAGAPAPALAGSAPSARD